MKKLLPIIAIFCALILTSACEHKFICQCKTTSGTVTYTGDLKSHSRYTARPYCDQHGNMSDSVICTVY